MSLQYTIRPISDRTGFATDGGGRQGSLFTVKWTQVLDLLQREYELLNGKHLVIEVDVDERGIRNDGLLRSDAKARTPAVRIAFDSKHGPIVLAADMFVRQAYKNADLESWQHNVYAIAKALEALRMVDRYGVSRSGEQYRGYKALGPGTGLQATGLTTDVAITILENESGFDELHRVDHPALMRAIRTARFNSHPDRNHGDRSRYDAVDQAVAALNRGGRLTASSGVGS